jgi:hypothetical protein
MTALSKILTNTKAMLADPAHWTKHAHARDEKGNMVEISSTRAVCFCLDGALAKSAGVYTDSFGRWDNTEQYSEAARFLRHVAFDATGNDSFVAVNDGAFYVNDETEHPGVLALLDLGIEKARQREQAPAGWTEV